MRLDLFLKNVGLAKRRSMAQEACQEGAVLIDGAPGRPGRQVRIGQRLLLQWPRRLLEVEILALPQRSVPRGDRDQFYRVIREEEIPPL